MTDLSAEGRMRLLGQSGAAGKHGIGCFTVLGFSFCVCGLDDLRYAVPALIVALEVAEKERDQLRDVAAFECLQSAKTAQALRAALIDAVAACPLCGGSGERLRESSVGEWAYCCKRCAPWRKALDEGKASCE